MDDLIEALTIFRRYSSARFPTACEHDEMYVCVDPAVVSDVDKARLAELSFCPCDAGSFKSYRFGSC